MIQEVIIVEGKQDIVAVKKAVDADILATQGFNLKPDLLQQIMKAYETRGIIILTDPDSAGERIRRFLDKRFPQAKHAFIAQVDACQNGDIGVEYSSPVVIRAALTKVSYLERQSQQLYDWQDINKAKLNGSVNAAIMRANLGAKLGIGYANAKQFLHRLNQYGIARSEFDKVVREMEMEHD